MTTALAAGTLLIASFDLEDHERHLVREGHVKKPVFTRTVVLLVSYDPDGQPLGLVINQPMGERLQRYNREELAKVEAGLPGGDALFHWGGPVQEDKLSFLHRLETCAADSLKVVPGLYFGGDLDSAREHALVASAAAPALRFFLGYTGWAPGQLEGEIANGDWILCPPAAALALDPAPQTVWQRALFSLGGKYRPLSFVPPDAIVN